MSYCRKMYNIIPETSYKIIRNCANCGRKSEYINTNCFRVNANGNKVDVWLIYQCERCRHTCNLTVYERVNPKLIKEEYEKFLGNDIELSLQYGTDKVLAEILKVSRNQIRQMIEEGKIQAKGKYIERQTSLKIL